MYAFQHALKLMVVRYVERYIKIAVSEFVSIYGYLKNAKDKQLVKCDLKYELL